MLDARTIALTLIALVAFASNSLLTRLALGAGEIDAASFTSVRLGAGALVLTLLAVRQGGWQKLKGAGWAGPIALFAYAAPFSLAYLRIGAAVGALVLFGVVQLTMIGYGIARGERPSEQSWVGIVLALVGLAILTLPKATRPDPLGVLLMTIAGVAWAVYSLVGRSAKDPLAANARSFLWSCPLALALSAATAGGAHASVRGLVLALISGALTSGIGYAVWYRALPHLTVTQAAVAQLAVPMLAALGAAAFLGELLTLPLLIAVMTVVSGVGLVLAGRRVRGQK